MTVDIMWIFMAIILGLMAGAGYGAFAFFKEGFEAGYNKAKDELLYTIQDFVGD